MFIRGSSHKQTPGESTFVSRPSSRLGSHSSLKSVLLLETKRNLGKNHHRMACEPNQNSGVLMTPFGDFFLGVSSVTDVP